MNNVQQQPSAPTRPRKRIYLINRDFQFRYSGAAVVVGLTSTFLSAVIILYPLFTFKILRIPNFLPWPIFLVMLFAALVNIALVGMMGIIITHRLAGPMYSLVRHLRRVEEGMWYGQMRLREGDEMRYVVRNFNSMMDGIQKYAGDDLSLATNLKEALAGKESADERLESVKGIADLLIQRLERRLTPPANDELQKETEKGP